MPQRKLQIFVSSTYKDLIDERLIAIEAILASNHIPAAMEQFTPGDEESWDKIKRWIDESDCYILILGARYGSLEPKSKKSYTELEYDYALKQGKPFMSLVMKDGVIETKIRENEKLIMSDLQEREYPEHYKKFKIKVTKKHCGFWSDGRDIQNEIARKLPEWDKREDLVGWVRADSTASPDVLEELAELSKENRILRMRVNEPLYNGVAQSDFIEILKQPIHNSLKWSDFVGEVQQLDFTFKIEILEGKNQPERPIFSLFKR